MHGNDDWWRDGDVLSFLFFAAELSSAFSFLIFVILAHAGTHRAASGVVWCYPFTAVIAVGLFYVAYCGECVFKSGIRRVWMSGFPCTHGWGCGGDVLSV
ncbi:hypothetical protein [Vibrio vulnificus]|uniref:hypothetical protein n=1 Tax=Vibrio vulnificus TaxID=672 RepID=UPI0032F08CD3